MKKTATYKNLEGKDFTVEYDSEAPCWYCGYPVGEASMGGTVVCGPCDMGANRFTMARWNAQEYKAVMKNFKLAQGGGKPTKAYGEI